MKKKSFCLLLLTAVLLFCAACGQTQTEQPEDTGDKDQYMTEPVPDGKPDPVEPQDTTVDTTTTHTCTFSISCETILIWTNVWRTRSFSYRRTVSSFQPQR